MLAGERLLYFNENRAMEGDVLGVPAYLGEMWGGSIGMPASQLWLSGAMN
jgi:hypothetical protein